MAQASISIRVDKSVKDRFCSLCEDFGLSTTTAFNLFMKAVIRERKIPFEVAADSEQEARKLFLDNFESMRKTAAENGVQDLSLDEINAIIKEVRDETRK